MVAILIIVWRFFLGGGYGDRYGGKSLKQRGGREKRVSRTTSYNIVLPH